MAINIWKATIGAGVATTTEVQTATAVQTVFNLASIVNIVGSGNLQVYINGVNQIEGATNSYIETDTTTITFNSGLDAGDEVRFIYLQ